MGKNKISEKIKILLICTESDIIDLFYQSFSDTAFMLKTVKCAVDGFETAKKIIPHIIIFDLNIESKNGFEFCEDIKRERLLSNSIFLLLTELQKNDDELWQKAYKADIDDILFKPIEKAAILFKIKFFEKLIVSYDKIDELSVGYEKAIGYLNKYKIRFNELGKALIKEKDLLHNSLKQITLMSRERDDRNKKLLELGKFYHESHQSVISVLSEITNSWGGIYRKHSKNVAEISVFIAKEQKLSPNDINNIQTAALLHEIGLLLLPSNLWESCTDNLTPLTKELLEKHSIKGSKLLKNLSGFEEISKIIRHLYEHVDGTGYPDGLKRRKIPICSRIIAVVDFFDTLAYGEKEKPIEDVLEILEQESGGKFDATVVYSLRRYINQNYESVLDGMSEVSIYKLEAGMELASGMFTVHGALLLPAGTVLSDKSLEKIIQYSRVDSLEEMVFIKK